jgi:hypothetical protein
MLNVLNIIEIPHNNYNFHILKIVNLHKHFSNEVDHWNIKYLSLKKCDKPYTSLILATQEAENRRIMVQNQPRQTVHEV